MSKKRKENIISEFKINENDTGSANVQVALLSERIKDIAKHLKMHKKDNHGRRGLLMIVGHRRKLLNYLKRRDTSQYKAIVKKLGLRK